MNNFNWFWLISGILFWVFIGFVVIFFVVDCIKRLTIEHHLRQERKERQLCDLIRESVRFGISDYKLDEICNRRKK